MQEYKTVLCGQCGRRIGSVHPKIKTMQIIDCRNCRKRNKYDPIEEKVIEVKEIPLRASSSGYTFI